MSEQTATLSYEPKRIAERAGSARSFVGHAKLIGFFTLISRVLGLAREIVAGHYLGTGLVASAFTVAFTVPNLFRKLFGEGALSAAFIPLYAQALKRESGETRIEGAQDGSRGDRESVGNRELDEARDDGEIRDAEETRGGAAGLPGGLQGTSA